MVLKVFTLTLVGLPRLYYSATIVIQHLYHHNDRTHSARELIPLGKQEHLDETIIP